MVKGIIQHIEQKEKETGIVISHRICQNNFASLEEVDCFFKGLQDGFENKYPNFNQLKQFSTQELIRELITRQGVEHGASGLYRKYDLTQKYTYDRRNLETDVVIIVEDLTKL